MEPRAPPASILVGLVNSRIQLSAAHIGSRVACFVQIRGIVVTFLVLLVVFQVVSNSSKANQWHLGLQRQNALWVAHPTARTKQPVTLPQGILGDELIAGETVAAASSSLTGKQQRNQGNSRAHFLFLGVTVGKTGR